MTLELLLSILTKVTFLFLLAWTVTHFLRRRPAAVRHMVWTASLLGAAVIPALQLAPGLAVLPSLEEPIAPAPTEWDRTKAFVERAERAPTKRMTIADLAAARPPRETTTAAPLSVSPETPAATPSPPQPTPVLGAESEESRFAWLTPWTVGGILWAAGVLFLIVRLSWSLLALARIARRAAPCRDPRVLDALATTQDRLGRTRNVRLLAGEAGCSPMTWGVFVPTILIPRDPTTTAKSSRIEAVLLHELAHIGRKDFLVQLLCRCIAMVFWFHPLAWLALHRIHLEQERACDDIVVRHGVRASDYAEHLVAIATDLRPTPAAALISTAISGPSELMSRMRYMLAGNNDHTRTPNWLRTGVVFSAIATATLVGALQPADAQAIVPGQGKGDDKVKLARRLVRLLDLKSHRDQAIRELAEIGRPAVGPLASALKDQRAVIVDGAIAALSAMPSKAYDHSQAGDPLLRILISKDRPEVLRVKAARLLGRVLDVDHGVFQAFLDLTKNAKTSADLRVELVHHLSGSKLHRKEVAKLLSQQANPGAAKEETAKRIRGLIDQLSFRNRRARKTRHPVARSREAFAALQGELKVATPYLFEALDHADLYVRKEVVRLLRPIRAQNRDELRKALLDPKRPRRFGALQILTTPAPLDQGIGAEILRLLDAPTDAKWSQALTRGLYHCFMDNDLAIEQALSKLREGKTRGAKPITAALLMLYPKHRDRILQEFARLARTGSPAVAEAVVTATGAIRGTRKLRARVATLGLWHREPAVIVASIKTLTRDIAAGKPGFERINELGKHASAAVVQARADYMNTMKLGKALEHASILVADYSDNRIVEFNGEGKQTFAIDEIFGVWDAERIPNGNLLITEFSVNRVTEIAKDGKVVWKFSDLKNPYDADRLPNGNTLIADTFGRRVIEVNRAGKIVWKYDTDIHPYDVDRLANGNTLIADTRKDRVVEVNPKGKIVWQVNNVPNVHDADRLANGNTLLTIRMLNEVREIDPTGKTVMQLKNLASPSDADRLPDGTTIVAENGRVRLFSPGGVAIWSKDVTWAVEVNVTYPKNK